MKKHTARIDNWFRLGPSLCGNVTNHSLCEFNPDTLQMTSHVISMDKEAGTAETENTHYTLGTRSKEVDI